MKIFTDHKSFNTFILDSENSFKDKTHEIFDKNRFLRDFHRSRGILFIGQCPIEKFIDYENADLWTDEEKKIKTDLFFKKLFEKFKISGPERKYLKQFISLFLHQEQFKAHPAYLATKTNPHQIIFLSNSPYPDNFSLHSHCKITLLLKGSAIYITQEHIYHRLYDEDLKLIQAVDPNKDFLVKGKATYKIEVLPMGEKGWIATYGLISSTIECKKEYKNILDERNILEKIIDFLISLVKNITVDINSDKFINSNPTIRSKPIFFISKSGEALDQVLVNPTKKLFKEATR